MAEPVARGADASVDEFGAARVGPWPRLYSSRWFAGWGWEHAVAVFAVVSAAAAFWATLDAHFLQYPGWLAVQKADFILGPIGVGLYWHHRRPNNRFGLWLIVLGLLGVPYILESSTDHTLFAIGVLAEEPIYVMTTIVILTFPSGRLEGIPERLVIALLVVTMLLVLVINLTASHLAPGLSISGCRIACPQTALGVLSPRSWHIPSRVIGAMPVAVALATAGVIAWRFARGTPPRRRALAIGAPVALLFLFSEAGYRSLFLFAPGGLGPSTRWIQDFLQWALAATRSFLWYGFLFALIAAELYAGRVLARLNQDSLGRPTFRELENMLREPLGDPGLRLGFWRERTSDWVDAEGARLGRPGRNQHATEIDRHGRAVIQIVHDRQLSEDPELLQAACAVTLLALENAELDAAWRESVHELRESRARLASAGERERRKLERDLHDGAQQRLVAATINLTLADEADDLRELHHRIADSRTEIEQALSELREISHGIYPAALARSGLSRAFGRLAGHYPRLTVSEGTVGRFPPEVELAVYYSGLEAVQNASKHAGPRAQIRIGLYVEADQLRLEVRDNGQGFDVDRARNGIGLQNIRDRLSAVGGHLEVNSRPGEGTLLAVSVPISPPSHEA